MEKQKALGSSGTKEALKLAQERYNISVKAYNNAITNYQNTLNKQAEFNNQIIEEERARIQREQDLKLEENIRLAQSEEAKRQVKLNYLIQETKDAEEQFGAQSIQYREALEEQKKYSTEFQNWKEAQRVKDKTAEFEFQKQMSLIGVENIDDIYFINRKALEDKKALYKEDSEAYRQLTKELQLLDKTYQVDSEKQLEEMLLADIEYNKRKANLSAETQDEIYKNEEKAFEDLLDLYEDDIEKRKEIQLEYDEWKKQKRTTEVEEENENINERNEFLLNTAQQSSDAIFSQQNENLQRRVDAQTEILTKQTNRDLSIVDDRLERGVISEEQATRDKLKIQEKALKEQEKLEKEAFEKKKKQDIAQALVNGALAVTKVLAQTGTIAPFVIPTIVATTGIQVATISAQKFAKGGLIEGNSHNEGGVPIQGGRAEVEGGEAIINKKSTAMFREELSMINQAGGGVKFAEGGVLGDTNIQQESNGLGGLSSRLDALIELTSMPVRAVVSETEITDSQSRINNIEQRSSF